MNEEYNRLQLLTHHKNSKTYTKFATKRPYKFGEQNIKELKNEGVLGLAAAASMNTDEHHHQALN